MQSYVVSQISLCRVRCRSSIDCVLWYNSRTSVRRGGVRIGGWLETGSGEGSGVLRQTWGSNMRRESGVEVGSD